MGLSLRRTIWILVAGLLAISSLLMQVSCAGDREKQELRELRKMANQMPEYPGFKLINEFDSVKPGRVSFSRFYESKAEYTEVRKFYDQLLLTGGWRTSEVVLGEQNYIYYRRGQYEIGVLQVSQPSNTVQLAFNWYSP